MVRESDMQTSPDEIRQTVREAYGAVASQQRVGGCCSTGAASCCGSQPSASARLGYTDADLASVPHGADLGLGCGNPQAMADLKAGERVLDLGSGGGFDAFLAARQVGPTGSVIGVDMTPEMIALARRNAAKTGLRQVEFRLGEIEQLPVADASIDVIMSNCVINLSPDKPAVFREAFRALAPGGRRAISDMVAIGDIPSALAADPAAYTGCVAGAESVGEIERGLRETGFVNVRVTVQTHSRELVEEWSPGTSASQVVASALIEAAKPTMTRPRTEGAIVMTLPQSTTSSGHLQSDTCCDTVLLSTCCGPEAKPECCGPASESTRCACEHAHGAQA